MKLIKRAAALVIAAVISAGCAMAAYAESPPGAGTPTGAGLLITDGSSSQNTSDNTSTTTPDQAPAEQIPVTAPQPAIGSSDKTFEPADLGKWTPWDGKDELRENTDYYISGTTALSGEFALPASSRLLISEGAQLLIYSSSKLSVSGEMIIAPEAELICSGVFSALEGSVLENYGNVKFTLNSIVNISSVFAAYGGSQSAMGGKTFVYDSGKFISYGTAFVPRFSEVTVTGDWLAPESGLLYIDGKFTTTLSGTLKLSGYTSVQEHARILNSGMIVIETTVNYYVDQSAEITNTKSGRIIDHRDPLYSAPAEEFRKGIKGIDVSVWQGVIDWQRVREAGIQFAIIRSSSGSRVDKLFDYNITEAQRAGILVGVYHYCYALTPEEAREEARHFIETIKPYRIDYPVMFDFEDNSQAKLGRELLTEIAEAFLSELKNAGYYPMIYSYRNWLENNLDMDRLSEYEVALAEWNVTEPKYTRPYGIWQYSCKGNISGIEGDVDLDLCYRDYAKIIREGGFNQLTMYN